MRRSKRGQGEPAPKNIAEFLEQAERLARDDIEAEEQRVRNYADACARMVRHRAAVPPS
jgi:hypothetical protein